MEIPIKLTEWIIYLLIFYMLLSLIDTDISLYKIYLNWKITKHKKNKSNE